MKTNAWVFDIEIGVNLFTFIGRRLDSKEYVEYAIFGERNDYEQYINFLNTRPTLIGFNSISFDAQIIEFMYTDGNKDPLDIYNFAQEMFEKRKEDQFYTPYSEWKLSHTHIDLFKVNHYDNRSKMTSLKWLEFTTRQPKVKDLPYEHDKPISKSQFKDVLTYNKNDVNATYEFFYICKPMLELRKELTNMYSNKRMLNMSDASIGSQIFKTEMAKSLDITERSLGAMRTKRSSVALKDCIPPYVKFKSDKFNGVLSWLKDTVVDTSLKKDKKKEEEKVKYEVKYKGVHYVVGLGGIHGTASPGVYHSKGDYTIVSADVASYYPNLAIKNKLYPDHLGEKFCTVYEKLYRLRKQYEKGSAMNYALKIALNGSYGKSKSQYSFLYDPLFTYNITISGQLLLLMIAEEISDIAQIIMINTDGFELLIHNDRKHDLYKICTRWEALTGLELEYNTYKKLVMRDVNNYWALDPANNIKRKGAYMIYDDYTDEGGKAHSYHKNPSATIIQLAVNNYYLNDIPVEVTITEHNDIYDFLIGVKANKNVEYWTLNVNDNKVIDKVKKYTGKVFRYYVSRNGVNLFKYFNDGRKNNFQSGIKGYTVTPALTLGRPEIYDKKGVRYEDINLDYYIDQAQEMIDNLENIN